MAMTGRPRFSASSRRMSMTAAAPSVVCRGTRREGGEAAGLCQARLLFARRGHMAWLFGEGWVAVLGQVPGTGLEGMLVSAWKVRRLLCSPRSAYLAGVGGGGGAALLEAAAQLGQLLHGGPGAGQRTLGPTLAHAHDTGDILRTKLKAYRRKPQQHASPAAARGPEDAWRPRTPRGAPRR